MPYRLPSLHPHVEPIPCRCLRWTHDADDMLDARHTTIQVLPDCVLHRHLLDEAVATWLAAEVAAAKAFADQWPDRYHPLNGWRTVIFDRLIAPRLPYRARHRQEVTAA